MKSIILCEGSTDFVLLQYFMQSVYGWQDKSDVRELKNNFKRVRKLEKGADSLIIGGCGGCSRLIPCLEYILEVNSLSAENEAYDKIVVITDRDEIATESEFAGEIEKLLTEGHVRKEKEIHNNEWITCNYQNGHGKTEQSEILLLVIPFESTGAMETFLLNSIAQNDGYDADIIEQCNTFVEGTDTERRYLTKRRYITKAKFDAYFSIRTAAEQFIERQNILKNVPWEEYISIQNSFSKLADLSRNNEEV